MSPSSSPLHQGLDAASSGNTEACPKYVCQPVRSSHPALFQNSSDCADMPGAGAVEEEEEPKPEAADEDMADPPVKVARSRWLDEEPEEEVPDPVNKVCNNAIRVVSLTIISLHAVSSECSWVAYGDLTRTT